MGAGAGRKNGTPPPTWLVLCAPVVVQVLFGLYPVIVKKFAISTGKKANIYIFTFYRDACAFPVLLLYSLFLERKFMIPDLKILPVFMVLGLFGMFGGQMLYITGVYAVGPDIASALQPALPVWTTLISIFTCTERAGSPLMVSVCEHPRHRTKHNVALSPDPFFGCACFGSGNETIPLPELLVSSGCCTALTRRKQLYAILRQLHTWSKFIGILLAAGGAIELALTGDNASSSDVSLNTTASTTAGISVSDQAVGYLSLLGNTLSFAIFILLQKRLIGRPRCKWKDYPVATTAYCYLFGALYMGVFSFYFVMVGRAQEFILPQRSLFALLYAIFITSAVCYSLITWTSKHLYPSVLTAFWPLQVFVAVTSAFIITGDKLAPWQYVGALALMAGLMLVVFSIRMDERLSEGRTVIRLDKCCYDMPPPGYSTPLVGAKDGTKIPLWEQGDSGNS